MKKIVLLVLTLGALLAPAAASAHPLGNFTVNRYSRLELSGERIYVLYVLDMAEIPTFQERQTVDRIGRERYAARLVGQIHRGLSLTVEGRSLPLRLVRDTLGFPPGVGGLRTMRLEALFATRPLRVGEQLGLAYRDSNYSSRIGWKEIVIQPSSGARLLMSSAPRGSISAELRSYPKNLLRSPLDVTSARAEFVPAAGAGPLPVLSSGRELDSRVTVRAVGDGGFASLIGREELGTGVILLSLLVALFWGAVHAFSPGHGKAIVAAYLVGSRGTPRHAVYLGLIVTFTHTIGVFLLGLVTLALSEFVVPEQLYPWLNLVSALLVVGVGATVLRWRLREWRRRRHGHGHHEHDHHGHSHVPEGPSGMRALVGLGISGGIIPCPTALVVLLAAISLHRVGYGLVLIVAFSVGLAAAMTAIGLLAVSAKRLFRRVDFEGGVVRFLPAASALVILAFGFVMTVRALPAIS